MAYNGKNYQIKSKPTKTPANCTKTKTLLISLLAFWKATGYSFSVRTCRIKASFLFRKLYVLEGGAGYVFTAAITTKKIYIYITKASFGMTIGFLSWPVSNHNKGPNTYNIELNALHSDASK